jgi:hypothetical protein
MTAYNVLTPSALAPGQPEDITVVLANFNAIAAVINALDNSNIAAAAAIAYSKLNLAGSILGTDIAPGAAIPPARIAGGVSQVITRKTVPKIVNTTVAATDLLNGEFTVPANAMGTNGVLRLTMWGDYLNNTGSTINTPRFQVMFGGTLILDTNTAAQNTSTNYSYPWRFQVEILNTATNAQVVYLNGFVCMDQNAPFVAAFNAGNGIYGSSSYSGNNSFSPINGWNLGAIDTTAARALVFNVINGNAGASCQTRLDGAILELI